MNKKFFMISLFCIIFMYISVIAPAESETLLVGGNENSVTLLESLTDYVQIKYTTGSLVKTSCLIKGETYYKISIPEEGIVLLKGKPDLPEISRSICITGESTVTLRILESEYIDIPLEIAPSKGSLPRTINPDDVPYEFSDTYSKNEFYPNTPAEVKEPYIFRDLTGITINVHPCAYNPVMKILRVYTKVVLEAGTVRETSSRSVLPGSTSNVFNKIYKNHFLNYTPESNTRMNETGSILVICYDDFTSAIQPYVEWKRQIGFDVSVVTISSIGNNVNNIKNYIAQQYNAIPDLAFVQLVGDAEHITGYAISDEDNGTTISDTYYTWISGNDAYPELIIGRFSAGSTGDVTIQVNKTIYYERDMPDGPWLNRATGIASAEGPGDDNEFDFQHVRNIRSDLLGYRFTQVDEFYDGSQGGNDASGNPTASMVVSALNEGRGFINYTGHGFNDRWATSNFTSSQVNSLQNNNMMPFIFSVACLVGKLNGRTCFAETWLRATNNGSSSGAVVMFGAPISQPWYEPMRAQDEFTDLLRTETTSTFGALCFMACVKMLDEGGDAQKTFRGWMIFGDASLRIGRSGQNPTPVPTAIPTPIGTLAPTPTPNENPIWSGGPYNLNGTSDYIDITDGITNDLSDFSIACWVKLNILNPWTRIFDCGGDTNIFMMLTPASGTTGNPYFCITLTGNDGEQGLNGPGTLPTGSWQHFAITKSGSTGILYINGQEVDRNTSMTLNPADMGNTVNNYIGRSQWSNDPYLEGNVDQFYIYDRALSASEVQDLGIASPDETAAPTGAPTSLGDVNGTGTMDIVDALLIAQYYVDLDPQGFIEGNADVDCSGSINIVDALLVAQYYVKLIAAFPC